MKITDIRTLSLSRTHEPKRQWYSATFHVPKADCSICIIETDEDLQGIAEPCAYGVPPAIAARIAELKPALIGRDPRDKDLTPHNEAVRANDIANAGLNCALWDLRGKIAGQTHRRSALRAGANSPASPPPLRFLGRALRLG